MNSEKLVPYIGFNNKENKGKSNEKAEFKISSHGSHVQLKMFLIICMAVGVFLVGWLMLEFKRPVEDYERGKQLLSFDKISLPEREVQMKTILLFNDRHQKLDWGLGTGTEPFKSLGCKHQNCFITHDIDYLGEKNMSYFDAVIFNIYGLLKDKKYLPNKRRNFQRYVLYYQHFLPYAAHSKLKRFNNFFNWTMTYRLDSDLPDPVGRIVPIKSNHSRSKEHKKLFGSTQSGSISEFVHHEKGHILEKEKLFCYYSKLAKFREPPMDLRPEMIDPFLCTHLVYHYMEFKEETGKIQFDSHEAGPDDFDNLVSLKASNPYLKVIASVSGQGSNVLGKFAQVGSQMPLRQNFVQSVMEFLEETRFDGIDLDWRTKEEADIVDKESLSFLAEDLRNAFSPKGLTLTASFSHSPSFNFDIIRLSEILDYWNIFTFNIHGHWEAFANHHAPFGNVKFEDVDMNSFTMESSLKSWVTAGVPKSKINVGLPLFGRSFLVENTDFYKAGQSASKGSSFSGHYSKEYGLLSFFEICKMIREDPGWTEAEDENGNSFAYNGQKWVGYDKPENAIKKAEYIKSEGFGGAMVWSVDFEDTTGACGEKWPVLSAIKEVLIGDNSKLVAWFQDDCDIKNAFIFRYINRLKKYINVDVYGPCGERQCPAGTYNEKKACTRELSKHYKFVIAFEDSFCKDVVSDYFFFVMTLPTVPIVLGHTDYSSFAPHGSYVDASKYRTPMDLANHLKHLLSDESVYKKHLQWKEDYRVIINVDPICGLCQLLNLDTPTKSVFNLTSWVFDGGDCLDMTKYPWINEDLA